MGLEDNEENVSLSSNYFIKTLGHRYYLSDLKYKNIVFEPYELSVDEYQILKKFNGTRNIKEIEETVKNKKLFKLLIEDLIKIDALDFSNKKREFIKSLKKPHLYDVHFEFESKCNMNCNHCYQSKYLNTNEKFTLKDIKRFADELNKLNVVKIALSGGEPFLRKDLKEICLIFKKAGIKVDCIFTNGVLISDEHISWLKEESIHIFISLDGGTPKSHGTLRNIPLKNQNQIFEKVVSNIKKLKKSGVITKINTCIHQSNIEELDKMYSLMKNLKIDVWRMTLPKIVGKYESTKDSFDVEEKQLSKNLNDLLKLFLSDVEILKDGIRVPFDLRIANIFKTEMLINPIVEYTKNNSACDYQKERITIKPNGEVVPCGLLINHNFGNIKNKKLKEIWYNKELQKIKDIKIREIETCKNCEYLGLCGGGCRVNSLYEFGDLFHKDTHACKCMEILFGPIRKLIEDKGFKFFNKKETNKKIYIREDFSF